MIIRPKDLLRGGASTFMAVALAASMTPVAAIAADTDGGGSASVSAQADEAQTYNLYTSPRGYTDHGKLTVGDGSANQAYKAGDTVTFTITVDDGYTYEGLYIREVGTVNTVDHTDTTNGNTITGTFTMPANMVNMEVKFVVKKAEGEQILHAGSTLTMTADGNVVQKVDKSSYSDDRYYVKAGAKVRVSCKTTDGYRYKGSTSLADGSAGPEMTQVQGDAGTVAYEFTMPESECRARITQETVKTTYKVTTEPEAFKSHAGIKSGSSITDSATVNAPGKHNFTVDNVIDGKYYDAEVTVSSDDTSVAVPNVIKRETALLKAHTGDATTYRWTGYGVDNATINVKFTENANAKKIQINGSIPEGNTFVSDNTMVLPGETVTLTLTADTANGYYYNTAKQPVVTDGNGNAVDLTKGTAEAGQATWTFKMPESGANVNADGLINLHEQKDVSIAENSKSYISTADGKARAGQKVTLDLTKPTKGAIEYVIVKSDDGTKYYKPSDDGTSVSFTMPEGDVEASAQVNTMETWTDAGNYDETYYQKPAGDWTVYTAAQFAAFAKKLGEDPSAFAGKTITLANDIDLSGNEWAPVKAPDFTNPVVIEGQGHTIKGLTVGEHRLNSNVRYFGMFYDGGVTLKNLDLKGSAEAVLYANEEKLDRGTVCMGGVVCAQNTTDAGVAAQNSTIDVDLKVKGSYAKGNSEVYAYTLAKEFLPSIYSLPSENNMIKGSISVEDYTATNGSLDFASVRSVTGNPSVYAVRNNAFLSNVNIGKTTKAQKAKCSVHYLASSYLGDINAGVVKNNVYNWKVANEGSITVTGNQAINRTEKQLPDDYVIGDSMTVDDAVSKMDEWVTQNSSAESQYRSWQKGSDGQPEFVKESEQKHSITVQAGEHGNVSASVATAEQDKQVRINITPEALYAVDSIKVHDVEDSSKEYDVTKSKNSDDLYTFIMGAKDVTVEVTFKYVGKEISLSQGGKGETKVAGARNGLSDKANPGETVKVSLKADDNYVIDSVKVTDARGNSVDVDSSNPNEQSFTMPDSSVSIAVVYKVAPYNEDKSLKAGTYTMEGYFCKGYTPSTKTMRAAMGYTVQHSKVKFTVKEDGTTHIDEWNTPTIQNPAGYAGFGEVRVSNQMTGDMNGNGEIADGDASDYYSTLPPNDKTNLDKYYPLTLTQDNVTSWYTAPLATGIRTAYTGEVHKVKFTGYGIRPRNNTPGEGYFYRTVAGDVDETAGDTLSTNDMVYPETFSFDLPQGVSFKNTGDAKDSILHLAVFTPVMGYYTQMLLYFDFDSLQEVSSDSGSTAEQRALEASKNQLKSVIDSAESVKNEDKTYTDESYKALTDKIASGKTVLDSQSATKDQIDAAIQAITDAQSALVKNETPAPDPTPEPIPTPSADAVTYSVPVTLMKKEGGSEPSMGNVALDGDAKVSVKDGKATYTITVKGVSLYNLHGHLLHLYVYDGESASGSTTEATVSSTVTDDALNGGTDSFPRTFTFTRDKTNEDKVYVRVDVDAMTSTGAGLQDAYLAFDWSKATKSSDSGNTGKTDSGNTDSGKTTDDAAAKARQASLDALNAAVKDAKAVKNDDGAYTADSYKALTEAVAAAEKAAADSASTKDQLDAAAKAVTDAKAALKKADKELEASRDALDKAVESAKKITNADGAYTADSFKALTDAIAAAEKASADKSATKADLDKAAKAVADAQAALRKADAGKADPEDAKATKADYAKLNRAIGKAEDVSNKDGRYTAASFKALADAVAAAEKVADDDNATRAQVDAARAAVVKAQAALRASTSATAAGITYKVSGKTATAAKAPASATTATVRATVRIGGKAYKVTGVKAGAFKKAKGLKKVTIGKNVTSIGKGAFKGLKSLRTIVFKGKKVVKMGKGSFKGISKKAVVKAPKSMVKKYQKMLEKAGAPKGIKVKKA